MSNSGLGFEVSGSLFYVDKDEADYENIAKTAEESGFDRIGVGDHVTIPEKVGEVYPYTSTGKPLRYNMNTEIYDPFLLLTYFAQATSEIRLATRACIVPYRHPVLLAKEALTLASLSGGRFDLGAAAGWLDTEFEVLDVPFEERGSRLDEFLDLLQDVMSSGEVAFEGPHHSFDRTGFYPRPVGDSPRIWIGGHSGAAFRRVAEYGHGWMAPPQSVDKLRESRDRLMNAWDDYNRKGSPRISTFHRAFVGTDDPYDDIEDQGDNNLVGTPDELIGQIEEYEEAGATTIGVLFDLPPDQIAEQMRRFGEEIIPSF